jgi:VanZ like family
VELTAGVLVAVLSVGFTVSGATGGAVLVVARERATAAALAGAAFVLTVCLWPGDTGVFRHRDPFEGFVGWSGSPIETAANVALYVPLGAAVAYLSRRGWRHPAAAVVLALPFVAEGLQGAVESLHRQSSVVDVAANLAGGLLGLALGARLRPAAGP